MKRRKDAYAPEPVEPRKPYDPDERVELAEVAKLCERSLAWIESRTSSYPGVMTRASDNHQWVRRGDIAEWLRLSDLERVEVRDGIDQARVEYTQTSRFHDTGPTQVVEWQQWQRS